MKKILCSLLVFAALCVPASVLAHPPSDIKFDYNEKEKMLKITVVHGSKDISKHFIDTVKVSIDGMELVKQSFMSQFNDKGQEASYIIIDVKLKTKVKVDAHCSKGGDLTREIAIK